MVGVTPVRPRVVVSGNGAIPWTLLRQWDGLVESYVLHLLNAPPAVPDREGVSLERCFVGPGQRRSARLAYVPARLSLVPLLFASTLPPDVVLVRTSPPYGGKVSLGPEVNILPAAIEATRARGGRVVAQVDPGVPYVYGDGELTLDSVHETATPLGRVRRDGGGCRSSRRTGGGGRRTTSLPPSPQSRREDRGRVDASAGHRCVPDAVLAGHTQRDQASHLIERAAHPRVREELVEEAIALGLLPEMTPD
ncbi:hypothetical protein BH18ACT9_BH18ACT9_01200 [soil metagenome]